MTDFNVLVIGGGPAGSVAAYWLAKGGATVTVVERSAKTLEYGQGIDVEGTARQIVEQMGVFEAMKAKGTGESGFTVVDDSGKALATIGTEGMSITSDIEIMRGDLCIILRDAANSLPNVTFQYGRSITNLTQDDSCVSVAFNDGEEARFQYVIGADGIRSKTRQLAMDASLAKDAFKPFDIYCAYFDLVSEESDGPNSRVQTCGGGRSCFVRPVNGKKSSGYLTVVAESEKLQSALSRDQQAQKTAMQETFADAGGLLPRVLKQMMEAENFYYERLGQVKLRKWSQGRVALIGDAAYAPSPITGQGTQLGICGAYVLAGELTKHAGDPTAAFEAYERSFRAQVDKSQSVPLRGLGPKILNPQSSWGVWGVRTVFRVFAWSGLWKRIQIRGEGFKLPDYPKLQGKTA